MQKKKYNVGYTSGVYDLFHVGHLNILRRAKEQCEYLIVAISTDELVQQYKNKTPVIPYEERKAIVEAIKYVDEVVPQVNRDKIAAFEKHHFELFIVFRRHKNIKIIIPGNKSPMTYSTKRSTAHYVIYNPVFTT
jgi:glycerol-3-phosphate cytidylyltransferase